VEFPEIPPTEHITQSSTAKSAEGAEKGREKKSNKKHFQQQKKEPTSLSSPQAYSYFHVLTTF